MAHPNLEQISRPNSMMSKERSNRASVHIAYLDGLRAFAVLSVLVRHAWGLSGAPRIVLLGFDFTPIVVMLGGFGVDLFFVLSGFLLSQSFFRRRQTGQPPPKNWDYWRARVLRIGPPYWVVLIMVVIFMTPAYIPADRVFSTEGLAIFASHLLVLQTLFISSFGAYSVETPFWTLTIEVVFYAALPLIIRAFYGRRWLVTVPLMAMTAVGWLMMVRTQGGWLIDVMNGPLNAFPSFPVDNVRFYLSHQFPAFLVDFALGISASLVVTSKTHSLRSNRLFQRLTSPAMGATLLVAGAVVTLVAMEVLGTLSLRNGYADPLNYMKSNRRADLVYYYFETIPFGIGSSLMLAGLVLSPRAIRSVLSFRPLAFIGVIGYSVYLIHMPILWVFTRYPWLASDTNPKSHFVKLFVAGVATTFALAILLFHTIERPAMMWSRSVRGDRAKGSPLPGETDAGDAGLADLGRIADGTPLRAP